LSFPLGVCFLVRPETDISRNRCRLPVAALATLCSTVKLRALSMKITKREAAAAAGKRYLLIGSISLSCR
jgi:hypothetical protein